MKLPARSGLYMKAFSALLVLFLAALSAASPRMPTGASYLNSLGMRLVRIPAGKFRMGENRVLPSELTANLSYPTRKELSERFPFGDPTRFAINLEHVARGDYDERPVHDVTIRRPFYLAVHEVTNAQYEHFDPSHRRLRGQKGFSKEDNEAAVFVSWKEAAAFSEWLSRKEGLPYRLPTEAEWEYACRAGTSTVFSSGDSLPGSFEKNPRRTSFTDPVRDVVPLTVGGTPANPWGLFDMHGNVEEWCYDWYGPYQAERQIDPVGRESGDFKVVRGGSHGTDLYYLRSANRSGALPENKHWLIGLRVALGDLPDSKPLPAATAQPFQENVSQETRLAAAPGPDPAKPYFKGPRRYVKISPGANGPLYAHHNHDAGITECANGDLLAIWYTCVEERGREVAVAASRLRCGKDEWEPASLFWDTPDRNDHCPALWFDGKDTLYHFNGVSVAGMWEPLAIIMRTSKDNGATWSKARLIVPEHGYRNMVGEPVLKTRGGALLFGADAGDGSTVWTSRDNGATWFDPGGLINGIHAGVVELGDGRLMALGRGMNLNGFMPQSYSSDGGRSWRAVPSVFPPLRGGQRLALLRLKDGALFLASFAKDLEKMEGSDTDERALTGLFGALSFDDGKTWPVRRWITGAKADRMVETIDGAPVLMNAGRSEPQGYLSVCQSADGVIHLISSWNHYAFNTAWLKAPATGRPVAPTAIRLSTKTDLPDLYRAFKPPAQSAPPWHFLDPQLSEQEFVSVLPDSRLQIKTAAKEARWSNERAAGFGEMDVRRGYTAEIIVQVTQAASSSTAGVDFGLQLRGGTLTANQYRIKITPRGLYYRRNQELLPFPGDFDNAVGFHRYRLAVRPDTAVQIYRDDKLVAVQPADIRIDWRVPARGSYLDWGLDPGVEAQIREISGDAAGAFRPTD